MSVYGQGVSLNCISQHISQRCVARFLSSGFITVIVVKQPDKRLEKHTSVHCAIAMQAYQTQGRIKLPGILLTKYHKVVSVIPACLVTLLIYKHTKTDNFLNRNTSQLEATLCNCNASFFIHKEQ